MTFKNYLLSLDLSTSTTETNYGNLCHFLNWSEDQNSESEYSTYNEILSYIKHLQSTGVSQSTVRLHVGSLKHYFNWIIKQELREDNPVRSIVVQGVKRKHLYHIIKQQYLEELYQKYPIPSEDNPNRNQNWFKQSVLAMKRSRIILGFMIWQGIKGDEISRITIQDLKLREGTVFIAGGRRSNQRELKLEAVQIMDLMEYTLRVRLEILEISKEQTDRLFTCTKGGADISNLSNYLIKKLKVLNPEVKSAKQIRASVITHWLKKYNLRQVQYMAGHRYVSSTEAYFINDLEGLSEDITKFHPLD